MINSYLNITVIAEWFTFFAALLLLNKKTGIWRFFISLLILILCVETIGWYQSNVKKVNNNSFPFNFLMIVSISFFLWLEAQAKVITSVKKYFYGALFTFIIFALTNLLLFQKLTVYNSITEVTGDILLAVFSGYLIFGLIKEDNAGESLFTQEYFWLAIGVLFSAMGSAVLYTFLQELQDYWYKTKIDVYGYINYTINVLLYTCLIISFICRRRTKLLQV